MTSKADDTRALVEAFGKRSPDALKLARAVSLASRVEPELLRKVRLKLLPDLDAGAEADLWFSPLVQTTSPLAFTFLPAVADRLRRELAESRDSLSRAWQVLSDVHEHSPAAIKLEERVTWAILKNGPTAHDDVEKELMSVVSAILTQNRTGLARWALRAVPRLPVGARQTKAAQTLLITAAAHLGAWNLLQKQAENNNLPATFINDLKVVLPSNLPQVEVGVRLLESDEFGLTSAQRSYVVEISNPPLSEQSDLIRVPGTVPLLLELSWNENGAGQVKQLSLYRGRVETIKVGATPVTIRTARGDVYTLSEDVAKDATTSESDLITRAMERIPVPPSIGFVRWRPPDGDLLEDLTKRLGPQATATPIVITGPDGIGKTTLAAEAARTLVGPYQGRVVWLNVEGHSDFALANLVDGVATQLGSPELRTLNPTRKSREVKLLLSAKPAIVFLDNFEILTKKEQLRCLGFLKSSNSPSVIISREDIGEEDVVGLRSMFPQDAQELLDRMIKQMLESGKFKEPIPGQKVIKVCRGNPLAMQLLLAQADFVGSINAVLDNVVKRRQRDPLLQVLDLSIRLPQLGNDARAALLAIVMFVPSGSRAAIAEVANFNEKYDRLDQALNRLRRLRLVHDVNDGGRWTVDAFVRSATPRLFGQVVTIEVQRRFIDYSLTYTEKHAEATATDYDALESELQNLLRAMDFAVKEKRWNAAIRMFLGLNRLLDVRGYWHEALRRNEQAQYAALKSKRRDLLPQLHSASGEIYLRRGEFAKAEKAFRAVLTQFGDTVNVDVADATRRLGSIAVERENLVKAKRLYSQALEISRQLKLDAGVADNLHNLAIVAQLEGKLDDAMSLYDESLRLSERVGDQRGIALSLHQLGVVAKEQGKYEQARNFFERSLNIKRSLGYRDGMADTLHQLGLLFQTIGEKQQATLALQQALTIYQQLSSPAAEAVASDLAGLTPESVAKPKRSRTKTRATKKRKAVKLPAKKSAAKKVAGRKRRLGIDSLFRRSARPRGGGRLDGRFGPRSRKSFR